MPSTIHGSSILWHHLNLRFDENYGSTGSNGFLLSLNAPYGGYPRKPKEGEMMTTPPGGERVDDWNHGAFWFPSSLPGMSLCIGAARSGKGAGIIVPALIGYRGNVVVNDPKGENFWVTGDRRRKPISEGGLGHKTVLADPFGEVNRAYGSMVGVTETVTKYNPLAELHPDDPDFPEDVAAIGEALTIDLGGGGGDNSNFFSGSGRDMIDGLIAATVTASAPGRGTLRNVRQWLNLSNADFAAAVEEFCTEYPDSLGAAKLRQFTDMTDRTNVGVKATAKQQTVFLDSEQLLRYMEPAEGEDTFSFSELSTGELDVYLVLPATHTVNYKRWIRLMVNQSMRAVLRSGVPNLKRPVAYLLDEAGTSLGHLDVIENAYGLTSGMGILCWSFYQDISQMKRDYPHSWQTFIANSATIQLLRVGDLETAQYFSTYMGHGTQRTRSTGESYSGNTQSSSVNYGETGRPVLMPDELMRVNKDEMITLYSGLYPMQMYKVKYFADARFNGLYRPDPKRQKTFPTAITPPAYVEPNTQGWWIEYRSQNGEGTATYSAPPRVPYKFPKWVKIALLCAIAAPVAWHFVPSAEERRASAQQSADAKTREKVEAIKRKLDAIPVLPSDLASAIRDAEEKQRLYERTYDGYSFRALRIAPGADGNPFKDERVAPGYTGPQTIWGIETMTGRHSYNGQTKLPGNHYRNFVFAVVNVDGAWKVTKIQAGVSESPTLEQLLLADLKSL